MCPSKTRAVSDGEPLRPYNASPDALLLNYKSSVMTFVPDAPAGLAHIQYDPPLAGCSARPRWFWPRRGRLRRLARALRGS